MKSHEIYGKILKPGCNSCISNLLIEVWDADCILDDLIGRTQTNSRGEFFFKFTDSFYKEIFGDHNPDLYFKIYRNDVLLKSTETDILWNVKQGQLQIRIELSKQDDPDCCSSSESSSLPLNLLEQFIPVDRFQIIFSAISEVTESKNERLLLEQKVQAFQQKACRLNLILTDAQDFFAGSKQAGTRLGNMLNTLLYFPVTPLQQSGFPPPSSFTNFPTPPRFRSPGRNLCLFFPDRFIDIFFAIERFKFINPQEVEIFQQYQEILHREVAQLAPLENIFISATEVLNKSPGASNYFKQSLMCFGTIPTLDLEAIPSLLQNSILPATEANTEVGSNIQPISLDIPVFDRPLIGIDLCRAERWARTEEAVGCWNALRQQPKYSITNIFNTTKRTSRRACVGDIVEIRGNNLGMQGKLTFGRRIEVTPRVWSETLITFEVPSLSEGQELRLCIDPQLTACASLPSFCRLPEPGTNLDLEIVYPITDSSITLTLSGPSVQETEAGQYTAEACTDIFLNVRVLDADNATVTDDRGDEVWTLDGESSSTVLLSDNRTDAVLTLSASNLCNLDSPFTRTIRLDIQYLIQISEELQVDVDTSERIELQISCPASEAGLPLNINLSDDSIASLDVSSATVLPGFNSVGFSVEGLQTGFAELTIEDPSGQYETTRVRVVVAPVITDTSLISSWINESVTIAARGLIPGNTSLLFPGSTAPIPASVVDETVSAIIPESAENGNIRVVVTLAGREIESNNSVRLRVNDPEITDLLPAVVRRGDNINLLGRGFSTINANNEIELYRTSGRIAPLTPDSSSPQRLNFSLPTDSRLFNNSLRVVVMPPGGISRSSNQLNFVISRREGSFIEAPFRATPGERSCGGNPIVQVDPPRSTMMGTVEVQEFPYRVLSSRERVTANGSFRLSSLLGGVAYSQCCDKVAVLSYNSGAFTPRSPARFNLIIYDVETGRNFLPSGTIVNSTSGSGMPDGFQEPRIYFSPDCTIAAVRSKETSGRDLIVFYDLERSRSNIIDRVNFSIIAGFSASINADNQIEYSINGDNQPPIEIS